MKKEEIINHYKDFKFYDLKNEIEERNMKAYIYKLQKEGKTFDHLKTIAPHCKGFKADYYYFESDNVEITEEILLEMGFKCNYYRNEYFYLQVESIYITIYNNMTVFFLDDARLITKPTANDLSHLIRILS